MFCHLVTKHTTMPARFVTNEVVTNCAGIVTFFSHLDIGTCDIVCVCVCVHVCVLHEEGLPACMQALLRACMCMGVF